MTVRYSSPASLCFATAAEVFAICIREMMPSCILAPPEAVNATTGKPFSVAVSKARVIFSPTTLPIDAIMKWESMMISTVREPLMVHSPVMTASFSPVMVWRDSTFLAYPGNCRGSALCISASYSTNEPLSTVSRMRSAAVSRA